MKKDFTIYIEPHGYMFTAKQGETLLTAAQRQGFDIRHACKNGVCYLCEAIYISGDLIQRRLPADPVKQVQHLIPYHSTLLTCNVEAVSDMTLFISDISAPGVIRMQQLACQVDNYTVVGNDIYRVFLKSPAGQKLQFFAGQYLDMLLPSGKRTSLSIANAPNNNRSLELHIKSVKDNTANHELISHITSSEVIHVELPKGNCYIQETSSQHPLVFIASGSGFSQMRAMLEFVFQQTEQPETHFYWSAKTPEDLYCHRELKEWENTHKNFNYHPILNAPSALWEGRTGRLQQAILDDFSNAIASLTVYACGSPTMVYEISDELIAAGVPENHIHSDVFSYAPRTEKK